MTSRIGQGMGLLVLVAALNARADDAPVRFDPIDSYGQNIAFDIYRDNTLVGKHEIAFKDLGGGAYEVRSVLAVETSFLLFNTYRFERKTTEVWRDGRLESLEATLDDDGDSVEVRAVTRDGRLEIDGPDGRIDTEPGLFPSDFWNYEILGQSQVLDTDTGKVTPVKFKMFNRERVYTGNINRDSIRYGVSGWMEAQVWYDLENHWAGLQYVDKDGAVVRYRCRLCANPRPKIGKSD